MLLLIYNISKYLSIVKNKIVENNIADVIIKVQSAQNLFHTERKRDFQNLGKIVVKVLSFWCPKKGKPLCDNGFPDSWYYSHSLKLGFLSVL